jgi:hypothetical protein
MLLRVHPGKDPSALKSQRFGTSGLRSTTPERSGAEDFEGARIANELIGATHWCLHVHERIEASEKSGPSGSTADRRNTEHPAVVYRVIPWVLI